MPADRTDPAALVGRVPPGDSAARRIRRAAGRMLSGTGDARELVELAAATRLPLSTGRRIAVTSVRGGAGKTAVAAMLALLFAVRRGEPVLAADAAPAGGSLAYRLGLTGVPTLAELAPQLLAAGSADLRSLHRVLPRTTTGLWVLPGGAPGRPQAARDVTRVLSRVFPVCVTDCGCDMDAAATTEVLAEAHAVVIVGPATPDGVRSTCAALERVTATGRAGSLQRVVVALNAASRDGLGCLRVGVAQGALRRYRVPVVLLPHDRHLAAGAPIDPGRVAEDTVVETTRLAARALERAAPL